MTIARSVIVAALRERAQHARADWVERTLPEQVDVSRNASLLQTLHLRVDDLIAQEGP